MGSVKSIREDDAKESCLVSDTSRIECREFKVKDGTSLQTSREKMNDKVYQGKQRQ